jgi:hypothetical protein
MYERYRIVLDHLMRLTDATGLFEHASHTIPDFAEGYCTDDNARALLLTVRLEELGLDSPEVSRLASTYAAFVNAAFVPGRRRFRNDLNFDRRWRDEIGSDDCFGRALWALGACVSRSQRQGFPSWALEVFERALPGIAETTSPRGWAFGLLGIHEYFRRPSGDRLIAQVRDTLIGRLLDLRERAATADWPWFEGVLAYDNAQLAHALVVSGHAADGPRARDVGLESLRWLAGAQKSPDGHFRPIGSNGFYPRGQGRAQFDQQPLEAHATVSACLARTPPSRPAWPRTGSPATPPGWGRHAPRSTGSWAATTWGWNCTTRPRAAVATGCNPTGSTRTRGRNRRWPSCSPWRR